MNFLEPTHYLDYEHEAVQQLVAEFRGGQTSQKEKAIGMYTRIRDGWRYNPYRISLDPVAYRASNIASKTEGHCIEKAILLAACARALDIPARLRLARVKNHIGVERLVRKFGTNELSPHGMVELHVGGRWLKVSPAFNRELCLKCQVATLDFDGETDSVFQQFDRNGNTFMEYLEDYGTFDEVPIAFIFKNFREQYPGIYESNKGTKEILL